MNSQLDRRTSKKQSRRLKDRKTGETVGVVITGYAVQYIGVQERQVFPSRLGVWTKGEQTLRQVKLTVKSRIPELQMPGEKALVKPKAVGIIRKMAQTVPTVKKDLKSMTSKFEGRLGLVTKLSKTDELLHEYAVISRHLLGKKTEDFVPEDREIISKFEQLDETAKERKIETYRNTSLNY